MAYFKTEGFDEIIKELDTMSKKAKELDGEHEIPFNELFTSSFMKKYTKFASFDSFLDAGGFNAVNNEEFDAIPEEKLNSHIKATTNFNNWEDMLGKAGDEYVLKKLGFDE